MQMKQSTRASGAPGRLMDRHGVRAELAMLSGDWEHMTGLERGIVYEIVDYEIPGDRVTVATRDGREVVASRAYLKLLRDLPDKTVVYQAATFGKRGASGRRYHELLYVAACDCGHRRPLEQSDLAAERLHCGQCGRTREWVFERQLFDGPGVV